MNKNVKRFFSVLSLSLLSITALTGCSKKQESIQHEQDFYNIYNLAVESGYNGDYASWLASIKGKKGDAGVGIESIVFKEVKNGESIFTVTFSNNSTSELAILNGKDGEKGPAGEDGFNGLSSYEQYVKDYNYIGSKEDFYKDFTNHHLGFKDTHTVSCYMYNVNIGGLVMPIFKNKVYKNGEKISFELPDLEYEYQITGAIDKIEINKYDTFYDESLTNDNLIDYKDYRAYCDTNILLTSYLPPLFLEYYIGTVNDGIKLNLGRHNHPTNGSSTFFTPLNDNEYDSLIGTIVWKTNGMKLKYDKQSRILKSNISGKCKLKIIHKNEVFDFTLEFMK